MANYGNSSLTLNVCPEVPGLVPKGLKLIISSKPHSNLKIASLRNSVGFSHKFRHLAEQVQDSCRPSDT